MEHLSLWELCRWNLEGGFLYWGSRKIWGGGLLGQVPPYMGVPLGSLEGARLPGTYVLKKALEMGICLHRSPSENLGGGGGCLFIGNSER